MRQKGRLSAKSVIHCNPYKKDITKAISDGIDKRYKIYNEIIVNPYGQGDASRQIVNLLKELKGSTLKSFHDFNVEK